MTKNTIIDLWEAFRAVPVSSVSYTKGLRTLDQAFLGWKPGTNVEDVLVWFDKAFDQWGGIDALQEGSYTVERKFQVVTPDGTLECYAKHEKDTAADYPGIFIDVRRTSGQIAGKEIGDLMCCVEYDSGNERLQTCIYALQEDDEGELLRRVSTDEPVFIERYSALMTFSAFMETHGDEMATLDMWDPDGNAIPDDSEIPLDAKVITCSRLGDSWDVTLDFTPANAIPERISIEEVRRGFFEGDIMLVDIGDTVMAQCGTVSVPVDEGITASAHVDTTPFEEDVESLWRALNAPPYNGVEERDAIKCLYVKKRLRERNIARDAVFKGRETDFPLVEQIAACYKYLNWKSTHKDPRDMSGAEILAAKKELEECEPGFAWMKHAGIKQMVPVDKRTGFAILA